MLVVDDDPDARDAYAWLIDDLDLKSITEAGSPKLESVSDFADKVAKYNDAVLCDHHLRKRSYASFDGAELVKQLYGRVPAVLCTRYEESVLDEIRPYREFVPVLLRDVDEESFARGLEICAREFVHGPARDRKPWRTQVLIEEVNDGMASVSLPGWVSGHVFRVVARSFPSDLQPLVQEGARLHAEVNLGAEQASDIYFRAWER